MDCLPPISLYSNFEFSRARGFLQIPSGGITETSTLRKPTLQELGIKKFGSDFSVFEAGFSYEPTLLGMFAIYQHNRTMGDSILLAEVMTHGIAVPRGTRLQSKNNFDLYRLGFNHRFCCADNWRIYPELEFTLFKYEYRLIIAEDQTSARCYRLMTPRLGIAMDYLFNRALSASLEIAASLPTISLQVYTAKLDVNYQLGCMKYLRPMFYVGIGYQYIDYQDGQPLPNHIKIESYPIARLGFIVHKGS